MLKSSLSLLLVAVAISGCSFAPIGENTFECNRKENPSPYCRSFKSLDKSTAGVLPESRFDKEFKMSDYDRAIGIAPDADGASPSQTAPSQGALPHQSGGVVRGAGAILPGAPVRQAAIVQRVWVKGFVDENDMLQASTKVYKEVQGSKWTGYDSAQTNNLAGAKGFPHRAAKGGSFNPSPAAPESTNDFNQPSSGGESSETGNPPPVSGASMPQ